MEFSIIEGYDNSEMKKGLVIDTETEKSSFRETILELSAGIN